jgi:phosphoenolpyruvate synthase/pyruvate phosphate dikinase
MSYVVDIVRLGTTPPLSSAQVGNKAAMLSRLKAEGFPIPDGYCITTDALSESRETQNWRRNLEASLKSLRSPWAVRSSSTAEDSPNLAFPGVFCTILGVSTAPEVFAAIDRVRESARGEVFQRYARAHNYSAAEATMAILIQSMIDATASGVAFSRHPVSGADLVSIDATVGLGEPLVSGTITPDNFEVERNGTVRRVRLGTKKQKLVLADGVLRTLETTTSERTRPSVSDAVLLDLAKLVRRIAQVDDRPQDVEWAVDSRGNISILQARPITGTLSQQEGNER